MGVVQAAQQMGLAVPRDLSVVGFDAVSDRFSFLPFITSVGYDRVLMGRRAVEILLQCRHGNTDSPKGKNKFIREVLPVYFVEGATTAPPRKRKNK
jgi:DNA-binding LacI/PurR family transcriptional regulator